MSSATGRLVLITGLSGFIALHIAEHLCKLGYRVRGTVRSGQKGDHVLALPRLKPYAENGQLSYAVVDDVATGDYTEAMQGVDAVVHAASPVNMANDIPWKDHKRPAVEGAKAVHLAAIKAGVSHIVQLSSFAALSDWLTPLEKQDGWVYNEETWNPITDEQAADLETIMPEEAHDAIGGVRYCASKKFSELAVLELHEEAKKKGQEYKLTVLCPPAVIGPSVDTITPLSKQGWSLALIPSLLAGRDATLGSDRLVNYVDVRDLASAVEVVLRTGAEGRFAIRGGYHDKQYVADTIRRLYPKLEEEGRVARGTPGKWPSQHGPRNTLDASKSIKVLGMKYRPWDDTIRATVDNALDMETRLGQ